MHGVFLLFAASSKINPHAYFLFNAGAETFMLNSDEMRLFYCYSNI